MSSHNSIMLKSRKSLLVISRNIFGLPCWHSSDSHLTFERPESSAECTVDTSQHPGSAKALVDFERHRFNHRSAPAETPTSARYQSNVRTAITLHTCPDIRGRFDGTPIRHGLGAHSLRWIPYDVRARGGGRKTTITHTAREANRPPKPTVFFLTPGGAFCGPWAA